MKQWQLYWASLQQREQQLLSMAAMVLAIGAFYWLVWQPLHQSRQSQQLAVQTAQQQLVWLQTQLPKLSQAGTAVRSNSSLTEVISQSSREFNIQVSRMQPQNEQLQLSLEDVPFEPLLSWLHQLQYQHGLRLVQFEVAAADVPGTVRVRRLVIE
jgi:general secretion pathway protein M